MRQFKYLTILSTFVLFVAHTAAGASELLVYDTHIKPAATYPMPNLGSEVYYTIMKSANGPYYKNPNMIKRCVLQHGHGISSQVLSMLAEPKQQETGTSARPNERPLRGLLRSGLQQLAGGADAFDRPEMFARLYFGSNLIDRLASEVCEELIIVYRETVQTSALEIVQQTERFLRDVACVSDEQNQEAVKNEKRTCALIAHSLSGLAGTAIVRRCMEADQGQSELGEAGCRALAEVYTAAPINQGSAATALALGAKELNDLQMLKDFVSLLMQDYAPVKEIVDRFTGGLTPPMDITGEYIPGQTNPVWMHIGPLAPMEQGIPVHLAHKDLIINKTGWFQGDYASSAGALDYGEGLEKKIIGNGRIVQSRILDFGQPLIFDFYSSVAGEAHLSRFKPIYEAGVRAFLRMSPELAAINPKLSWQDFQVSDGVVELNSAQNVCLNGLKVPTSAVTSCTLNANVGHLAMAGAAESVATDVVSSLLSSGRKPVQERRQF